MSSRAARQPRNRNTPVPGTRRAPVRALLCSAATVVGAVVLALGGAGGTYAYLNDAATASGSGGTMRAGTAALTVTGSPLSLAGMYPTLSRASAVTVQNTGDVPLQVRVQQMSSSGNAAASLRLRVANVANAAACTTSVATGVEGALTAFPTGGVLVNSLATGGTATLCLIVTMPANAASAAQNQSANFTLTLQGVQS